jgi:hypothetical protein
MAPPAVVPFTPPPTALFTPITKECAGLQASINKVVWPRPKTLWREESQKDEEEKKPKEKTLDKVWPPIEVGKPLPRIDCQELCWSSKKGPSCLSQFLHG